MKARPEGASGNQLARVTLRVQGADGAGRVARHTLVGWLRRFDLVDTDTRDTVELLTSELVTNALRHAVTGPAVAQEISLRATLFADVVRVEVEDGDPTMGRRVASDEEGGRGLLTVSRLAKEWGVIRCSTGKTVWFTCSL
jgi:anti-sigma regulatory factor (Ser/Thr protein kinase)